MFTCERFVIVHTQKDENKKKSEFSDFPKRPDILAST